MGITWTGEAERDMMIAVQIAQNGDQAIPGKVWAKAAELIKDKYPDATASALSQRWSKVILKDYKKNFPNVFADEDIPSKGSPGPSKSATRTPTRRGRPKKNPSLPKETSGSVGSPTGPFITDLATAKGEMKREFDFDSDEEHDEKRIKTE
ncbi:hypothetical protein GGS20DRAFT_592903 [Poronia punctata]|nr:hypothetical protein GGS20DRAFT_592903 [Poronia punctata]